MNKIRFNHCLRQIRQGNLDGLEMIYNEYYEKFVITANQILHNYDLSEDVASDMIENIIEYAKTYEYPSVEHPGAFLYSSVRNLAKDVYNRGITFDDIDDIKDEIAANDVDRTNRISIEQAFKVLDSTDVDIAEMYYFYRYKMREIAIKLNIPLGTVKWRLFEIRKKLLKFFEKN